MERYILLLVVTSEQEDAIQQLFSQKNWRYIKPALTEAVSSRLASINSELPQALGRPCEKRDNTIDEIYNLANEVATDICRNMAFNSKVDIKNECGHSEKDASTSIIVKQEDTATSGSDTEIESYDIPSAEAADVSKSDDEEVELNQTVDLVNQTDRLYSEVRDSRVDSENQTDRQYTEISPVDSASCETAGVRLDKTDDEDTELMDLMESSYKELQTTSAKHVTRPSTRANAKSAKSRVLKDRKRSKDAVRRGPKKPSRNFLEMRKILRKRNTSKKVSNIINKSKASRYEKTDRCSKCQKYFTHSQFIIHEAKDRCQLICCYCEKNFGDNFARYNRHIRNVHTSANLAIKLPIEDKDDGMRPEPSDRDSKNLPVSGAYHCSVCGTSYVSLVRYTSHMEKGNCKKICGECGKVFLNNPQNYLVHTRTHSKSLQFPCDHCRKSFVTQAKLQRHMKEHTGGVFPCHKCPMTFNLQSHLSNHQKVVHTNPKVYCCDLCGVVYKSIGSLKYHTDTTHSEHRPYSCHICEARFKVKVTLKAHMQVHTEYKNYQCSKCCKQFKTRSQLRNHERRHAMRYSHTCDVCTKGFYDKRTLTDHKNTHSGDKPYKCLQCEYACASMGNLVKHKKIHDSDSHVGSARQPDLGSTHQQFIGSTHQQDFGSGHKQDMGSAHQPNLPNFVSEHKQDMGRTHQPAFVSGHKQDMGSAIQQDFVSGHKQDMGSSHQQAFVSGHKQDFTSAHQLDYGSGQKQDLGGKHNYDLGIERQHETSSMLAAHRDYIQSNLY